MKKFKFSKLFKFNKLKSKTFLSFLYNGLKLFTHKWFLLVIFVICFSFLAIFGLKSRWGSSVNHSFKGTDTISWSNDIGNEAKITLSYPKALNEEEKEEVENMLQKRLHLAGFGENKIYFDQNNKFIIINMPLSYNKPLFDFNDIAQYLVSPGRLKFLKTSANDLSSLFGLNQQNKKEEFLMDNGAVKSVTLKYIKSNKNKISKAKSRNNVPSIEFNLYDEDRDKLLERYGIASQKRKDLIYLEKETKNLEKDLENLDEKEKKETEKILVEKRKKIENLKKEISAETIEIQIDDHNVYSGNILELLNEDNKIIASNSTNTPKQVLSYINLLSSSNLTVPLSVVEIVTKSPEINSNIPQDFLIFISVVIILIILLISLKNLTIGLVSLISIVGHLCFIIACFSGFFSFFPGFCVNIASVMATSLSVLIGLSFILYLQNKIRDNSSNSVDEKLKDSYKTLSKLNVLIMVVSIVLMGIFAPKNDILYFIFSQLNLIIDSNTQNSVFSFFYAILVGSIAIFLFELSLTSLILKSISLKNMPTLKFFNKSANNLKAKNEFKT